MAFPADAVIQSINGPVTVGNLAERCAQDPDTKLPVFSWDGERVTVGLACECRPSGQRQVIEVILDDRSVVRTTLDVRFLLRDMETELSAAELERGASLLPLYLGEDKTYGYPLFKALGEARKRAPATIDQRKTRKVSRMVGEWLYGAPLPKGTYVEHIDGDRKNCHPDNLRIVHDKKRAVRQQRKYKIVDIVQEVDELVREFEEAREQRDESFPDNHSVYDVQASAVTAVYDFEVRETDVVVVGGVFLRIRPC